MATEDFKRKLTAILSADVKDYSRLMGDDQEATVRIITTHRKVITSVVEKYRGRVVDSPGDNLLAEFGSVVDAVNCAVEIQRELAERNADLPRARQMEFRIGVNLGDIVQEEGCSYRDLSTYSTVTKYYAHIEDCRSSFQSRKSLYRRI